MGYQSSRKRPPYQETPPHTRGKARRPPRPSLDLPLPTIADLPHERPPPGLRAPVLHPILLTFQLSETWVAFTATVHGVISRCAAVVSKQAPVSRLVVQPSGASFLRIGCSTTRTAGGATPDEKPSLFASLQVSPVICRNTPGTRCLKGVGVSPLHGLKKLVVLGRLPGLKVLLRHVNGAITQRAMLRQWR